MMSPHPRRSAKLQLRILVARAHEAIGPVGLLGLLLMVVAAAIGLRAWHGLRQLEAVMTAGAAAPASPWSMPLPSPMQAPKAVLADEQDIPLLLARMQRTAVDAGLGWPKADYKVNAASAELPSSLEVKCAFKGPYPAVRRFVTGLLLDEPALTLREFNLSRSSADGIDVEARVTVVVYLLAGTGRGRLR